MQDTNTTPIKIYRDGQLDRWETYSPVIQAKLVSFGNKLDYWFTHFGEWPDRDLIQ